MDPIAKRNMSTRVYLLLLIALTVSGAPCPAKSETDSRFASYEEFRSALSRATADNGAPIQQSAPPETLPDSEQELKRWLNWGEEFISAEPTKCPSSAEQYDFVYEAATISDSLEVDLCFRINAARRHRSTTEPPNCDQRNARFYACLKFAAPTGE